jgi:pimeloyl-ACP methyl ester carboxylesterase
MKKSSQTERMLQGRQRTQTSPAYYSAAAFGLITITYLISTYSKPESLSPLLQHIRDYAQGPESPYGSFPIPGDPFQLIPCTNTSIPPNLEDENPSDTWKSLFDPVPEHWSWGKAKDNADERAIDSQDSYSNRGIYLCGFIDLPLNPLNDSDYRIVRLAVTKYQVSGLARARGIHGDRRWWGGKRQSSAGAKSERTILLEPGGPGASGTREVWLVGEDVSERFSSGQYDVLGWDPRGVNVSHPSLSCYPHDSDRYRWAFVRSQYRADVASPMQHLRVLDAMNNATFHACHQRHGDFGRFVDTTFLARDLEGIRSALGEEELTGHFVSYGTAVGTTYANMFPDRIGRLILDSPEYIKDQRQLGGFAWASLHDVVKAWREGLLGECINAGPEYCPLAAPISGKQQALVTVPELEARIQAVFSSLVEKPMTGVSELGIPAIITYSQVAKFIYVALYNPKLWPTAAQIIHDLERGNATLATATFEQFYTSLYQTPTPSGHRPHSAELPWVAICANSYDAEEPEGGLVWWDQFWASLVEQSWISGSFRMTTVLACRHYKTYWPDPPGVFRGDLNATLRHPVLVIAGTHDPATPLSRAEKLVAEMGDNARLVVHHAYGHMSEMDRSNCTDALGRAFLLNGTLPRHMETHCFANEKPYRSNTASQHELRCLGC